MAPHLRPDGADTMGGRSSPTRYRMEADGDPSLAVHGGGSSPTPMSYSSSSVSTASTSIFPGIPNSLSQSPEHRPQAGDSVENLQWIGQPLIPRRITARKKKMRPANTGYISSDTSCDQHHHVCRAAVYAVVLFLGLTALRSMYSFVFFSLLRFRALDE